MWAGLCQGDQVVLVTRLADTSSMAIRAMLKEKPCDGQARRLDFSDIFVALLQPKHAIWKREHLQQPQKKRKRSVCMVHSHANQQGVINFTPPSIFFLWLQNQFWHFLFFYLWLQSTFSCFILSFLGSDLSYTV